MVYVCYCGYICYPHIQYFRSSVCRRCHRGQCRCPTAVWKDHCHPLLVKSAPSHTRIVGQLLQTEPLGKQTTRCRHTLKKNKTCKTSVVLPCLFLAKNCPFFTVVFFSYQKHRHCLHIYCASFSASKNTSWMEVCCIC